MLEKVKLMAASLFVLLMMFFTVEISAQIDTTDQDTTIYPDTTTYPDSLNYEDQSSIIQLDVFDEAGATYYVFTESCILPKENAFVRQERKIKTG